MSFLRPKTKIDEGDTVIIFLGVNSMHSIQATPTVVNRKGEEVEHIFQTSFGALKVRSIIGLEYGKYERCFYCCLWRNQIIRKCRVFIQISYRFPRVSSSCWFALCHTSCFFGLTEKFFYFILIIYGSQVKLSKGWAYILQPNPQLWTQTLPHRTQIIYTPDISMIIHQLDLRPGSVIVESGTGSGSLSHFLLHAIKPSGHLHTFDFHEARAKQAQDEFQNHGLSDFVCVYNRDVCEFGFGTQLEGKVDAVFLDLPAPQLAVPHAVKVFKKNQGGRFCSFSPCIEQSQRCCEALKNHGFTEIQSLEILQQENQVKTKSLSSINLDFVKHKKPLNSSPEEKQHLPSKDVIKVLTTFQPMTHTGHTGFLTFATLPPVFAR
uniref:tRNA (adenine(58)-N(1))-methyltransferase catalytic subunit TRMT61A n=1 Tax=Glossina pallidipes TaxID=7398 RepID=A0A1B0A673_GLOPL